MSPATRGAGAAEIEKQFRRFAAGVGRENGAARYERICSATAADPEVLALVAAAPPAQRRPNILLAAVHYLLLSGVEHPLAAYYPTVAAWRGPESALGQATRRGAATGQDLEGVAPAFADFCREHRDRLLALVATRATQTNEVGRCTALLPALCAIGTRTGVPLAVLDLGASAGLNLLFDRYAYDYRLAVGEPGHTDGGGPRRALAGDPRSAVVLSCEVSGISTMRALPRSVPRVAARAGLDRSPVDVRDEDAVLWLLACQWPDDLDRFLQACAALSIAREAGEPPRVAEGDMVEDLAAAAAALPPDAHLCLVHTWVAAYLSPACQRRLLEAVGTLGAARPVTWLYAEAPGEARGLPMPARPPGRTLGRTGSTALVLVDVAPGRDPVARRLADMHSHGRWLTWYG